MSHGMAQPYMSCHRHSLRHRCTGVKQYAALSPECLMARHNLVGLATDTGLVGHGPAGGGAGPLMAALCTPVPPTGQQLVACGATHGRLLITRQVCVLYLYAYMHSFILSSPHPHMHSFVHPLTHTSIHSFSSFIHSLSLFICSLTHSAMHSPILFTCVWLGDAAY